MGADINEYITSADNLWNQNTFYDLTGVMAQATEIDMAEVYFEESVRKVLGQVLAADDPIAYSKFLFRVLIFHRFVINNDFILTNFFLHAIVQSINTQVNLEMEAPAFRMGEAAEDGFGRVQLLHGREINIKQLDRLLYGQVAYWEHSARE